MRSPATAVKPVRGRSGSRAPSRPGRSRPRAPPPPPVVHNRRGARPATIAAPAESPHNGHVAIRFPCVRIRHVVPIRRQPDAAGFRTSGPPGTWTTPVRGYGRTRRLRCPAQPCRARRQLRRRSAAGAMFGDLFEERRRSRVRRAMTGQRTVDHERRFVLCEPGVARGSQRQARGASSIGRRRGVGGAANRDRCCHGRCGSATTSGCRPSRPGPARPRGCRRD